MTTQPTTTAQATQAAPVKRSRAVRRFVRHYLEMVLAMLVGMIVLYPVWMLATSGVGSSSVLRSAEVESLVMATTMAVPMVAWMRVRGHGWAPALEMSAAMYAGFVVLFPALWSGAVGEDGLMMTGHVLMFVFMLLAMLWRREEYAGAHHHGAPAGERPGTTMTAS